MRRSTSTRAMLISVAVLVMSSVPILAAPQIAAAQVLTAPRYHGQRPAGCTRFVFLDTSLRSCVYPDNTIGMWTDQDSGAVLVMFDDADGNGLQFTDDGLYLFGLN